MLHGQYVLFAVYGKVVIMDFLDFLTAKDDEVLTGTYYNRRPKTPKDRGVGFSYDIVDEGDRSYSKLLDSLEAELSLQTIKSKDYCCFKVKGYVVTQEGGLWQITGIIKRLVHPETKEALRILRETASTEYVIRLIEVQNPWGLK